MHRHASTMQPLRAFALACLFLLPAFPSAADLPDSEIRALLIRQSIAVYPGNCPCPYNLDRAGRRCGARSAYSKPGGRSPLCYPQDVTEEMIERFRKSS
jgi:hypothetical protein